MKIEIDIDEVKIDEFIDRRKKLKELEDYRYSVNNGYCEDDRHRGRAIQEEVKNQKLIKHLDHLIDHLRTQLVEDQNNY